MKLIHALLASSVAIAPVNALAQAEATDLGSSAKEAAPAAEIVVTGSRAITNGEQAPTPVTVLSSQQLRNTAPNLAEALRQLPQLTASGTPATPNPTIGGGPSTQSTADLRNLGANRTLTLLNGRRPAIFGGSGLVDTGVFPQALISRVDIVTGGASSAYGSDAISGVVNYVVDTDYQGLTAEARHGISTYGDAGSYAVEVAGGTSFGGGRGHVVASFNMNGQQLLEADQRDYNLISAATIPNPLAGQPGQPQLIYRENATIATGTFGGRIITPGLNTIRFDAAGNPVPYTPGTESTGALQVGGDGASYPSTLVARTRNWSAYGHAKYALTDDIEVFAEGSFGHARSTSPNLYFFNLGANGAYTVRRDNAYLPESIGALMDEQGLSAIQLGKIDRNYGRNVTFFDSDTWNATIGANANLWGNWKLDIYGSHSVSKTRYGAQNNRIQARSRLATDAVFAPDGGIVCRSSLTDPGNGCVPTNPFGETPLTQAQRDYLTATSIARSTTKQDVAALSLHGDVVDAWAGAITGAVGVEYRKVSLDQVADPIGQANGFTAGNLKTSSGSYNVKEAFAELQVPLLRDVTLAQDLSLNAAIRRTDYSTSGAVTTWKVGLTDEVFHGFRLRASLSQDIRAPNINELFGGVVRGVTTVRDPNFNGETFLNIFSYSGSNADLGPEKARTLTAGAVYRPDWLPGFGLSVDYYRIKLSDAITQVAFQTVVDQCGVGNALFCSLISRGSDGRIVEINAPLQNVQSARVSGVDFEANYQTEVGNGDLNLRALGTYLDQYRFSNPGAATVEQAGTPTLPRWRANFLASYTNGGFTMTVQERYVGKTTRVVLPTTVDDNTVKSVFYTNLTLRYRFEDERMGSPELFMNVNNLFNQAPRVGQTNSLNLGFARMYDGALYDIVGRFFTVGARVRF
ncbi:TonB-dependent receptor domain-containing protein [Novosphingobium sp. MBES04]|uniref:TonB-dependent receptor domain-containing protein n=1 Tax=Novosphingobium sp. MBES04 TaxID=1206458 RepID=UPI00131EF794|nr:TonB-dependent receptor [Novosphingobium sp. MBES04]